MNEAWYEPNDTQQLPLHLDNIGTNFVDPADAYNDVMVESVADMRYDESINRCGRNSAKTYADPMFNHHQLAVVIACSLAVTRDWHRHRTMYPFTFRFVRAERGPFILDRHYEPKSEIGLEKWEAYFQLCADTFDYFVKDGDMGKAMLCAPFGSRVELGATCGLRDLLYCAELRAFTHGANFEYQDQAEQILKQLRKDVPPSVAEALKIPDLKEK